MNQNYDRIFLLILFWKISARVLSEVSGEKQSGEVRSQRSWADSLNFWRLIELL